MDEYDDTNARETKQAAHSPADDPQTPSTAAGAARAGGIQNVDQNDDKRAREIKRAAHLRPDDPQPPSAAAGAASRRDENVDQYDDASEVREHDTHRCVVVNVGIGDCDGRILDVQAAALRARG